MRKYMSKLVFAVVAFIFLFGTITTASAHIYFDPDLYGGPTQPPQPDDDGSGAHWEYNTGTSASAANTKITLNYNPEPSVFNVSLPTALSVYKAQDGTVTLPDNISIINNCAGPVRVTSVRVIPGENWSVVNRDTPMNTKGIREKSFSLGLNGDWVTEDCEEFISDEHWPVLAGHGQMNIDIGMDISTMPEALNENKICDILITVEWVKWTGDNNQSGGNQSGGSQTTIKNSAGGHLDNSKWRGIGFNNVNDGNGVDAVRLFVTDTIPDLYLYRWDASLPGHEGEVIAYACEFDTANGTGFADGTDGIESLATTMGASTEMLQAELADIYLVTENGYVTLSEDASEMFFGVKYIDAEHMDTSNVTNMYRMFTRTGIQGDGAILAACFPNISGWDTTHVTNMSEMFSRGAFYVNGEGGDNYKMLESLDVSSVKDFSGMFSGIVAADEGSGIMPFVTGLHIADELRDVYAAEIAAMPDLYIEAVELDLSGWNMASAENVTDMYKQNMSFNITRPSAGNRLNNTRWNGYGATVFYDGEVTLSDDQKQSISENGFEEAVRLFVSDAVPSNYLYAWDASTAGSEGGVIAYLTHFDTSDGRGFEDGVLNELASAMGGSMDDIANSMYDITLVTEDGNVTLSADASEMFARNDMMVYIETEHFDVSNVINMSGMFSGFYGMPMSFPDISSWDTSKVQSMSGMFGGSMFFIPEGDNAYKAIENLNVSNVTNFSGMFREITLVKEGLNLQAEMPIIAGYYLNEATQSAFPPEMFAEMGMEVLDAPTLNLSSWNTSKAINMRRMFQSSGSFEFTGLDGWDVSKVTDMSEMFAGEEAKAEIAGIDFTQWNTSSAQNMAGMFAGATGLEELDLTGWDTSHVTDMRQMFMDSGFERISIGTFTSKSIQNMSSMFEGCQNLEEITLTAWTPVDSGEVNLQNILNGSPLNGNSVYENKLYH